MLQATGSMRHAACGLQHKRKEKMQSYKDLDVYKISHKLAVEIHKITLEDLPKFEMFEEGMQIRKSSNII